MSTADANNLLFGSGPPSASFDTIGTVVKGPIVNVTTSQRTDFNTKEPLWWGDDRRPTPIRPGPDAQPVMQAIVTVQTDQRDGDIPSDDGQRRIFLGGRNIRDAVRDAVTKVGRKEIEVGGQLAVKYTAGAGGANDPKQFTAEYKPPAVSTGLLDESPTDDSLDEF